MKKQRSRKSATASPSRARRRDSGPSAQTVRRWRARWDADHVENWNGLDKRLKTVAPAFEGIIDALWLEDEAEAMRVLRIGLDTQSQADAETWHRGSVRGSIVLDWMARCALPLWLDRLPPWCEEAASTANGLRRLGPLMFTSVQLEALEVLRPLWLFLETDALTLGTAEERNVTHHARLAVQRAMGVLSASLERRFDLGNSSQIWICSLAMGVANGTVGIPRDAAIMATLPALLEILKQTDERDSWQAVADRCVWQAPKRTRRAA